METADYNSGNIIENLPTEERRQYAKKFIEYAEYFKEKIEQIEHKTIRERIADKVLITRKKEKQEYEQQKMNIYATFIAEMTEYSTIYATSRDDMATLEEEFVIGTLSATEEEGILDVCEIGDLLSGQRDDDAENDVMQETKVSRERVEEASVGTALASAASSYHGLPVILVGAVATGIAKTKTEVSPLTAIGLPEANELSKLSDKEQVAVYKKALETMIVYMKQHNISEEKLCFRCIAGCFTAVVFARRNHLRYEQRM